MFSFQEQYLICPFPIPIVKNKIAYRKFTIYNKNNIRSLNLPERINLKDKILLELSMSNTKFDFIVVYPDKLFQTNFTESVKQIKERINKKLRRK